MRYRPSGMDGRAQPSEGNRDLPKVICLLSSERPHGLARRQRLSQPAYTNRRPCEGRTRTSGAASTPMERRSNRRLRQSRPAARASVFGGGAPVPELTPSRSPAPRLRVERSVARGVLIAQDLTAWRRRSASTASLERRAQDAAPTRWLRQDRVAQPLDAPKAIDAILHTLGAAAGYVDYPEEVAAVGECIAAARLRPVPDGGQEAVSRRSDDLSVLQHPIVV